LFVLAVSGLVLSRVGGAASRWQAANQPAFQAESLQNVAGQGLLLGIFGGYRSIIADFAWVRAYIHWTRQDRASCETLMRLSITLDPDNIYFWKNTANAIAFDMPHWEARERRRDGALTLDPIVEAQLAREYGERGLELYARAAARHPDFQAWLWTDCALVCLLRMKEPLRGAEYYRMAAECPKPLWFAAYARVNVLCDLGMRKEAVEWLRGYIEKLRDGRIRDTGGTRAELENILRKLEARKR
jgi:hypothetical protein